MKNLIKTDKGNFILGKHGRKFKAKRAVIGGEVVWFIDNHSKEFARQETESPAYTDEYYEQKEQQIIQDGPNSFDNSFIDERPSTFLELKQELLSVEEYRKLKETIKNGKT